jgi:hypothetical protein
MLDVPSKVRAPKLSAQLLPVLPVWGIRSRFASNTTLTVSEAIIASGFANS